MDLLQSSNRRGFHVTIKNAREILLHSVKYYTNTHKTSKGVPCFREKGFCVFFPIIYRNLTKLGN